MKSNKALCLFLAIVSAPTLAYAGPIATSGSYKPEVAVIKAGAKSTSAPAAKTVANPLADTGSFLSAGPLSAARVSAQDTASGRTLYVSSKGSDSAKGTKDSPWKSIRSAVSKLKAGDTLFIAEGNYNEAVKFGVSGTSEKYITIQGVGKVVISGKGLGAYTPAFATGDQKYLRFKNLTVNDSRAAVEVSSGSSFIEIDGLKTDRNDFAVYIKGGKNVTVKNAYAITSRNAFRADGSASNLVFENIETYGSKDMYKNYDKNYLNGDGFIFEDAVSNVTLRNITSGDHWDGGFDIKASNVVGENLVAYGNKNNFKLWGKNITLKNILSYRAKKQLRPDGSYVDGNGFNVRRGNARLENVTVVDNDDADIKLASGASVHIVNSVVARNSTNGRLLGESGKVTQQNVVWYNAKNGPKVPLSGGSKWADPKFVDWAGKNYRLKADSPASGAYNFKNSGSRTPPKPAPEDEGDDEGEEEEERPKPATGGLFTGIKKDATISGSVKFQPDLKRIPDVRKVAYYLNDDLSGREYEKPFTWGGDDGFNTRSLKNGKHTLLAIYSTSKDDVEYEITFTVKN